MAALAGAGAAAGFLVLVCESLRPVAALAGAGAAAGFLVLVCESLRPVAALAGAGAAAGFLVLSLPSSLSAPAAPSACPLNPSRTKQKIRGTYQSRRGRGKPPGRWERTSC